MQAITSGTLAALSDITAQKLASNAPLNWRRTLALALFGFVWSGPSNHYWQLFTNQLFKGKKDAASVAQKVCELVAYSLMHTVGNFATSVMHEPNTITRPCRPICNLHAHMQVLIDNLVYSPIFNLLVMAYIGTVVEGKQCLVAYVCNCHQ